MFTKNIWIKICCCMLAVCLTFAGCGKTGENTEDTLSGAETQGGGQNGTEAQGGNASGQTETETETEAPPEILHFVDAHGDPHQTVIQKDWKKHPYDTDAFAAEGDKMRYESEQDPRTTRLGIDVSYYQGAIDWKAVREAGFEFVFVRIGYRGYGQAGTLCEDKRYKENIKGALAAGMDVGVYFFSQAISEEEAVEEAEYVFQLLQAINVTADMLKMPVVFDAENILHDDARTDNVTGEQFTKNAAAFCRTVEDAGFQSMIFTNMKWEAYTLDLGALKDYPIWYADYEPKPQTPYDFSFWQYSESAHVNGIKPNVDVDIQMK